MSTDKISLTVPQQGLRYLLDRARGAVGRMHPYFKIDIYLNGRITCCATDLRVGVLTELDKCLRQKECIRQPITCGCVPPVICVTTKMSVTASVWATTINLSPITSQILMTAGLPLTCSHKTSRPLLPAVVISQIYFTDFTKKMQSRSVAYLSWPLFAAAQNDSSIKGVLFYGDTPGGTVDGTMEAADVIASYRGNKPVLAFTDGMIASAGVWLLAGADEIYISSDTNPIGSIGVVAAHVDVSKREEMWGRKITEITAGDYKRIASNYAPLTSEGRAQIQADLDYIYTAFVNHVAAMRGLDVNAHEDWANGRVFLGKQAIAAGLADGISTMDELINRLSSGQGRVTQQKQQQRKAVATSPATLSQEEKDMDAKKLKEEYPGVVAEIEQAARAGMVEETKVAEERARVVALAAAAFGEEAGAKFGAVVDKGLSAEDLKTLGICFATTQAADSGVDKESREQILVALKEGGNQPVGKLNGGEKTEATGGFADKVATYARENKTSRSEAIKACRKSDPKGYAAWIADANANAPAESGDEE